MLMSPKICEKVITYYI